MLLCLLSNTFGYFYPYYQFQVKSFYMFLVSMLRTRKKQSKQTLALLLYNRDLLSKCINSWDSFSKCTKVMLALHFTVQSAGRAMNSRTSLFDTSASAAEQRTQSTTRGWCHTLVGKLVTSPSVQSVVITAYSCVTQVWSAHTLGGHLQFCAFDFYYYYHIDFLYLYSSIIVS